MKHSQRYRRDSMFDGDVVCYQSENGYRFSIDAVLLAGFWHGRGEAVVLDMGCGCGILGLVLLYRYPDTVRRVVGLEFQQSLVEIARRNVVENNYDDMFEIVHGEVGEIARCFSPESFSHVICNPPFYSVGTGRPSRDRQAYLARHQVSAQLDDFIRGAAYALKNRGSLAMVYPAERTASLLAGLEKSNMQPKRMRYVFSYPEAEAAELILVECFKNGGEGVKVMSPLYLYRQKNAEYTPEVAGLYARRSSM